MFILPLCLAATIYYIYAIYAAIEFFKQENTASCSFETEPFTPSVSILKPLCGLDGHSYQNLASFLEQDYPQYQVVFCVRDGSDPIVSTVNQLIDDFPEVDIALVISDRLIGYNFKVSNLANGLELAKYDILVLADDDIRVDKNYLFEIVQPLKTESVGAVTCLYKSKAEGCLGIFEGLGIACDFFPSVLVAQKLEGIRFAFGSTIAIKKQVLEAIGGFAAIADRLADDFLLGYLPTQLGYQVVLSNYIVNHHLGKEKWRNFWSRQIRWFRCARISRFWGYLGIIVTQGTVTSILLVILTRDSLIACLLCLVTLSLRLLMAHVVGFKYIKDPIATQYLGLVFITDILRFVLWLGGFFRNEIEWRGKRFRVLNNQELFLINN